MKSSVVAAAVVALLSLPHGAVAGQAEYGGVVAAHARANGVPEALVHRVIMHESRYQPELIGHGGTIGLMQIKLATARGLGYTGDANGLRDPDTNLTYAVRYLAGAYRAANGDHARAMRYYAGGYYYAAKRQRQAQLHEQRQEQRQETAHLADAAGQARLEPDGNPQPPFSTVPRKKPVQGVRNARALVPGR